MAPVRVAIANDYEIVIAGIAALLAPYQDRVAVVELAANAPVDERRRRRPLRHLRPGAG